jgi:hypothetical protein
MSEGGSKRVITRYAAFAQKRQKRNFAALNRVKTLYIHSRSLSLIIMN